MLVQFQFLWSWLRSEICSLIFLFLDQATARSFPVRYAKFRNPNNETAKFPLCQRKRIAKNSFWQKVSDQEKRKKQVQNRVDWGYFDRIIQKNYVNFQKCWNRAAFLCRSKKTEGKKADFEPFGHRIFQNTYSYLFTHELQTCYFMKLRTRPAFL